MTTFHGHERRFSWVYGFQWGQKNGCHEYFIGLFVKIVVLGYTKCKKHCSIITIILVLGFSSLKVEVAWFPIRCCANYNYPLNFVVFPVSWKFLKRLYIVFFSFFNTVCPLPNPTKNILQHDSNFQALAHIEIIPGKPVTSLATKKHKMALKLGKI